MTTPESAVERCTKAYYDKAEIEDPHDAGVDPATLDRIRLAYRHAMPYLLPDPASIDAFLACVTHGLVIQVFEPAEASKLLYAAQVAIGSIRARAQICHPEPKAKDPLVPPSPAPTPSPSPQPKRCNRATTLPCPIHGDSFIVTMGGRPRTPTRRTGSSHPTPPPRPHQAPKARWSHRRCASATALPTPPRPSRRTRSKPFWPSSTPANSPRRPPRPLRSGPEGGTAHPLPPTHGAEGAVSRTAGARG